MNIKRNIIAIVFLLLFCLINDYFLSFYGKGYNLLGNKIVYEFNLDFDKLEGFKVEEENFIQIIGFGTKINEDIVVKEITAYTYNFNGIFCRIIDKNGQNYFVETVFDKNAEFGNRIKYNIISKSKIDKDLKWYNVSNSSFLKGLELIYLVLKLILFLFIIIFCKKLYKKIPPAGASMNDTKG
jgi:hypothetical protein